MSKRIKIPVGYTMKSVSELKAGNVIYIEGKIVEVYTIQEEEEWIDADTGLPYLDTTVVYLIESYPKGTFIKSLRPSGGTVRVLRYAYLKAE